MKRACRDCEFWKTPGGGPGSSIGDCTVMPKWEMTKADHYCGHFEQREVLSPPPPSPDGACSKVYRKLIDSGVFVPRLCKRPAGHEGECGA
jgi:hypothetical protein